MVLFSQLRRVVAGTSNLGYAAFFRVLLATCVAIAAQNNCPAEQKPRKPLAPSLRANTDLVRVRAIFVDSRGRRITNLRADDIVLKDNGEVQKLSTFEAPRQPERKDDDVLDGRSGEESTLAGSQDLQAQEVLILLLGMEFTSRHYALEAVAKYLESKHNGLTKVAVADASGAVMPFTSQDQEMTDFARSLLKVQIPPLGFESRRFRQSAVRFCESMKELTGKKAIVLFSDFYGNHYRLGTQPADLVPMALDIGAAVYPVDARGVMTVSPIGDASSATINLDVTGQAFAIMHQQSELAEISSQTGGDFLPGNDLGAAFREVERDASSSYLLEYYKSGLKHDGTFHSIKIIAKRRGIHARVRKGYYAPIPAMNEVDPNSQLRLALASDYPFRDVRINFRPFFLPGGEAGQTFTVTILGLQFRWALTSSEPFGADPLLILGTIRAPGNRVEDFSEEGLPNVTSETGTPPTYHLESTLFTPPLRLPAGDNVIKVAARAASGMLGNAVLQLAVPEPQTKDIRISSLIISRHTESLKTSEQHADSHNPLIVGDAEVVPEISSQFKSGENLIFFARVAGGDEKTPLSASLSVKTPSGVTLAGPISTDLRQLDDGSHFGVPILFRLPASNFAHEGGLFVAVLTIKRADGKVLGSTSATLAVIREDEGGSADWEP